MQTKKSVKLHIDISERHPPSWIFEVFGPFCTLRDPIFYVHTKFGEYLSIDDRKTPPGGRILLPVLTLTIFVFWRPSYVSSCKISAKSDNRRPSYSDFTIWASFGAPFVPTDLRVRGTYPHLVGTMRYAHHPSLTGF